MEDVPAVSLNVALAEAVESKVRPATPPPGVYRNVPFVDYWSWGAINHSFLEPFNSCPAVARYRMFHPEESDVLSFGHAFHCAILEPERFQAEFVTAPEDAPARRSNVDKQWWADFEKSVAGRTILTRKDRDKIQGMQEAVYAHAMASEFLASSGAQEVSIVWVDQQSGVTCKARLDKIGSTAGWTFIIDIKTAKAANDRAFQKDIAYYHYHQQAAMYVDGLNVLAPRPRRFAFLVVEKEPPYLVAVHELEEGAIEQGRREYHAHLEEFKRCEESGVWPGLDSGLGLISLPPWAQDSMSLSEKD